MLKTLRSDIDSGHLTDMFSISFKQKKMEEVE